MVISDLNHLEETSERVIGGLSIYVTSTEPVELEVLVPVYGEPVLLENGSTSASLIGFKPVKTIIPPTTTPEK